MLNLGPQNLGSSGGGGPPGPPLDPRLLSIVCMKKYFPIDLVLSLYTKSGKSYHPQFRDMNAFQQCLNSTFNKPSIFQ